MNARRTIPQPPPLLWSEEGRICCVAHAPYAGSDTWRTGRWRRMRDAEIAAFAATTGMPTACEICSLVAARAAVARR